MKKVWLALVALALLIFPSLDTRGICPETSDVLCGYRCSSNSCVSDTFTDPTWACWLDFGTVPVSCGGGHVQCCASGPGL